MKLTSVYHMPAGESIDVALGESLWSSDEAITRFRELWSELASAKLGVPVTIAGRSDFVNASRTELKTEFEKGDPECDPAGYPTARPGDAGIIETFRGQWTSDHADIGEPVDNALDAAFAEAADKIRAEFSHLTGHGTCRAE